MNKIEQLNNLPDILDRLREIKATLRDRFGIIQIAIFGSYATGEQTPNSDIDIVIIDIEKKNAFLTLKAKKYIEEHLSIKVDIGLYSSLNPFIRSSIKDDLIYV